jgi:hypothetical protein
MIPMHLRFLCIVMAVIPAGSAGATAVCDSIPDLDQILRPLESEGSYSRVLERLLFLQEHPLDLNTAGVDELRSIPGVDEVDARAVVDLRTRLGRFTAASQLDSLEETVPGLPARIRPFIVVKGMRTALADRGSPSVELRSRAVKDLQPRRGYLDGSFAGSQLNSYSRLVMALPGLLEAGALFEKDAGEAWSSGFRSGYLELSKGPGGSRAIIGDFDVGAGQGLVFWGGASFERGTGAASFVRRSGGGAEPNRSADESRYMRGVVAAFAPVEGWEVSALYSSRTRSATVEDDGSCSTFDASGLCRTNTERARANAVRDQTVGARCVAGAPEWSAGITLSRTVLNVDYIPDRSRSFSGRSFDVGGIDGKIETGSVTWFAEAAGTRGGNGAVIAGAVALLGLRTETAVAFRSYGPDFVTLHGAGYGQGEDTRNEQGISLAMTSHIGKNLSVAASFDQYRHPWHTPLRIFPSSGSETFLEGVFRPRPRLEVSARYTFRRSEETMTVEEEAGWEHRIQYLTGRHNVRLTAAAEPGTSFRSRTRLEIVFLSNNGVAPAERGFLAYQDVTWKAPWGVSVEGRLVFFDTDSYDARVYAYENDVRGVFANPALYGRGRRWYVLVRSEPLAGILTFSCKYAATFHEGVTSISSGLMEIAGDTDDRLGLQLDINW